MNSNKGSSNASMLGANPDDEAQMDLVVKSIYSNCDPNQTNSVETSKLIEFIKPFMNGDISALNSLKEAMDPENKDASVSWNTFYSVMNDWTRKFGERSSTDSFESSNKSPSKLDKINPAELPYIQSTPRASFGKKLLNCSGLLSLSQNSSFVDRNLVADDQIQKYENEIDKLKQQLNKIQIEHKLEIVAAEEQNELLQLDIDQLKKHLKSEKSLNEQISATLQKEKKDMEDLLNSEISGLKIQLNDLQKKLALTEKENVQYSKLITKLEQEKIELESKIEALNRRDQEMSQEIMNIRMELEVKEQECISFQQLHETLNKKIQDQEDVNDQLRNDFELVSQSKESLEKLLKGNLTLNNSPTLLAQYKSVAASAKSSNNNSPLDTSSTACFRAFNSPKLLRQLSSPVSPSLDSPNIIIPPEKNSSLRNKLLRTLSVKSSTPDNSVKCKLNKSLPNFLDSSVSSLSPPIMYVLERTDPRHNFCTKNPDINKSDSSFQQTNEESSEEDLIRKMIDDDGDNKREIVTECDSLQSEMNKTDMSLMVFLKNELLAKQEDQIEKLTNELNNCKDMKDSLANNLEKCRKEIENKNMQIQELQKKIKQDLDWKKTIQDKLQSEIYDKAVKIEELKQNNSELINSNNLLNEAIKSMQKEYPVDRLVFQCEDVLNNVQFEINERHSVTGQLVQLNKELKDKLLNMEGKVKAREKEIKDLKEIMESEMETRNSLWDTIKDLENQIEGMKKLNNRLVDEQANAVEELIDTLNYESNKNETLAEEIQMKTQKVSDLNSIESYLRQSLEAEKSVNASKDKKISQLYKEIDLKTTEITELKEKLNETTTHLIQMQDNISEYEIELDINKKELDKYKMVEKQLQEREEELASKSELISAKEKEISELQSNIQQLNHLYSLLNQTKENYVNELDFKDNFANALKAENAFLNASINEILQKLYIDTKSSNLEENVCKLKESINELIKRDKIRSKDVEKLKKDVQTYMKFKTSYETIKNAFEMVKVDLNRALMEKNKLTDKLKIVETDRNNLQENLLKESRDKNQLIENLKDKYNIDLKEAQDEILTLKLQLQSLDLELANKKSIIELLERDNLELKENLYHYDELKQNFSDLKQCQDYEKQLDIVKKILDANNSQLVSIKEKINVESENLQQIILQVENNKGSLYLIKEKLIGCINLFKTYVGESKFEDYFKFIPEADFECEDVLPDIKEEFNEIEKLITLIVLIIESLIIHNVFEKDMSKDREHTPLIESHSGRKDFKKFTMRMPHLTHPESPDSPSLEMNIKSDENCCRSLFNEEPVDKHENADTIENTIISRVIPNQVAFPNLSDAFLEKVGLHETSAIENLSKEEIESLFTRLVVQLSLDAKDAKERYNFQYGLLHQLQSEFTELAKKIIFRLRDHKCIGAQDSINGVFVLLENLKHLEKEIAISASQCGCLCYELRMMTCWDLVTKYMAVLRRDIKPGSCQFINSSESESKVKKRSKNKKTDTEIDSVTTELVKPSKWKCLPLIMKCMLVLSLFIAVLLFAIVQINCSQWANSSALCPLDVLIRRSFIGDPPR